MTADQFEGYDLLPADVTSWLKSRGWQLSGSLSNVAERWQRESSQIVVPNSALIS